MSSTIRNRFLKLLGESHEHQQTSENESLRLNSAGCGNVVEVGWWGEANEAKFIHGASHVYWPSYPPPEHQQTVNNCAGLLE